MIRRRGNLLWMILVISAIGVASLLGIATLRDTASATGDGQASGVVVDDHREAPSFWHELMQAAGEDLAPSSDEDIP